MSLVSNITGASELHIPTDKSPGYFTLENASTCVLLALITWRFWRFTISPFLHPERPKEFPYWIPCHGRAFFQDSNGLLSRARNHFQNTKDPIALTVFGMTFYVVTQAKHSAEVYRNKDTLSFENFVQVLMKNNSNSEQVIQDMYSDLPAEKSGFPNPHGAQRTLLLVVRITLSFLSINGARTISFALGNMSTLVKRLIKLTQTLPDVFFVFDELIFKMLYQFPRFLSNDMSKPRARVIASLKKYFEVPQSKRSNCTAWLINAMEDEMRTLGVDDDNLAVVIFHLYLAINTNTRKSVFWMLTYLLHNPTVLARFRQETKPAFKEGQLVNNVYIQEPTNCPLVDQIWLETLRLSGWAASVRLITEDTVIGGKLMSKGNRVMVPHRLLHFDESIFGEDPQDFRPERWQKECLARSPSWRPFGGGQTMCSGRFLAGYSVTTFAATLLQRFDIELVGNPPIPQADEGRPVLGIMSIKEGQDFNIRISPRVVSK
ncbi:Beta-amyrin 11-oxidase [Lachnellula willkommii]|uniref:Beta-amyrin 11-oxidase n=1 Tax=Lachnellula willkommii TaxID=215461 RepID=A0A559MCJ4_9HELO|nr:Beta-amyrin 11-oxidase [Lachnellula willkommii]